jgi:hypothetical protein
MNISMFIVAYDLQKEWIIWAFNDSECSSNMPHVVSRMGAYGCCGHVLILLECAGGVEAYWDVGACWGFGSILGSYSTENVEEYDVLELSEMFV